MSILDFVSLGLVQGLTEFLPISSSGHLWLLQYFWGMDPDMTLEVFLHGASLLAVIVCLRKKIWSLLLSIKYQVLGIKGYADEFVLSIQLIWATIVTVPVALLMEYYVLIDLSLKVVAGGLIVTGLLIWVSTKIKGAASTLTWSQATLIGLIQGVAVLPGISRSGITIVGLLFMGVRRKEAAEFSFLLSIPTILGALIFTFKDVASLAFLSEPGFYVAALICFLVAMGTIHFMLRFIHKWWGIWAIYCLGLGAFLLLT